MLDTAKTGSEPFKTVVQIRLAVSEAEDQLMQRYRQMPEQERRQVERLIEVLTNNPLSV